MGWLVPRWCRVLTCGTPKLSRPAATLSLRSGLAQAKRVPYWPHIRRPITTVDLTAQRTSLPNRNTNCRCVSVLNARTRSANWPCHCLFLRIVY